MAAIKTERNSYNRAKSMPRIGTGMVEHYLTRLGYSGSRTPSLRTLKALHRHHLLNIPFENLSIHAGEPIRLDRGALFRKIIERKRGGFCYELNGLFCSLLRAMGFDAEMLQAGVARKTGGFGPDFDHMVLLVQLKRGQYIVDVGFGDLMMQPLRLCLDIPQDQHGNVLRLRAGGHERLLLERRNNKSRKWAPNTGCLSVPACLRISPRCASITRPRLHRASRRVGSAP